MTDYRASPCTPGGSARPRRPTCQIRKMVHVENSNQQSSSGEGLVSILHVRRVLMAVSGVDGRRVARLAHVAYMG